MAERDSSPVHVHLAHVGAGLARPCQHDAGEGFVDLDESDLVQGEAGPVERLAGRGDRRREHQDGVVAREGERDEAGAGPQTQAHGRAPLHDQQRRRGIADLRRVARRDQPVRHESRLERGKLVHAGVGADAFVPAHGGSSAVPGWDRHRHDLRREAPVGGGARGPAMALQAPRVEIAAAQAPLLGDPLGADALRHETIVVAAHHPTPERLARSMVERRAHRHPRHRLHAAGNHHIVGPAQDTLRREVYGLLA